MNRREKEEVKNGGGEGEERRIERLV